MAGNVDSNRHRLPNCTAPSDYIYLKNNKRVSTAELQTDITLEMATHGIIFRSW